MEIISKNGKSLQIKSVHKFYDNIVHAVNDVSIDVVPGEFLVLVGPSGCGKSTMLRMLAGLEKLDGGDIILDGNVINKVMPKKRDIAMVFQNYALYPTMRVYDNIAFPLKMRKFKKDAIKERVIDVAQQLGIEHLLNRQPAQLSGGQRQRVALGRAIVREPALFLMDEPLSNLDAELRVQMRHEIVALQRRLGITTVYVTHDQVEAMTMGTRIAVMKDGVLQQVDTPTNLYQIPINSFVAKFIGSPPMNIWQGKIDERGIAIGEQVFSDLPLDKLNEIRTCCDEALLGIRPEDFILCEGENGISVEIIEIEEVGRESFIYLYASGVNETLILIQDGNTDMKRGDSIRISADWQKLHLFDVKSKERIAFAQENDGI